MSTTKVIAYVTHGDRLLVFRHTEHPEAGIQVPGGTVHEGEPLEQAVLREAHEETGLVDLQVCAYLGLQELDRSHWGLDGVERRHYFHLAVAGQVPDRWLHCERDPSDGSSAPIEFELYWVRFPDEVPFLSGGQGTLLKELEI
jgi:ADP-ribose pyrophosphatase YjhB (NUDIX family)